MKLALLIPFLRRMRPHARWLGAGIVLACVSLAASLALLALSGGFLAATAIAGLSAATAQSFNYFAPAAGVRFFALLRTVGRWAERVVTHEATFRLIGGLRVWLFEALLQLSPAQLARHRGADLLGGLTRDIDAIDNLYLRLLVPSAAALFVMLALGLLWGSLEARLLWPWAGLVAVGVMLCGLAWRLGRAASTRLVALQAAVRRELVDALDGLEDYQLHAPAWQAQRQRLDACDGERIAWQLRQQRALSVLRGLVMFGVGLALWAALGLLTSPAGERLVSGPWLAAVLLMILASLEVLQFLPQAWFELPGTVASAARLDVLAQQPPLVAWPAHGPRPRDATLEFAHVGFWHDPSHRLLQDFCDEIAAGTHVAVIGPSGEGKSTLLELIARLRDPCAGEIRLGGCPLPTLDEPTLRRYVSCAPQEVWLMTATLADNLRLACPAADAARLWQVLEVVGLRETVAAWPEGLETWIEEGGASLSGGERRRLGVARALLREAPITLLDEPTEGLDPAAEHELLARVRQYLAGRTLIWVSHRDAGLAGFDRVLRLESGRLRALDPRSLG